MNDVQFEIRGQYVAFGEPSYNQVVDFIHREIQMLDDEQLEDWLNLLTDDIEYFMPIRLTKGRDQGSGFSEGGYYDENKTMLGIRVKRFLESKSAWVEDPPSRTRRFISNVRLWLDDNGDHYVRSNYLVLRNRLDEEDYEMISAERRDIYREVEGQLKLAKRHIYCDQAVMGNQNLVFFL